LPTVICGFFLNASASASRRVKEVPAGAAPCAADRFAVAVAGVVVAETVVLSCRSGAGCGAAGCGDWPAAGIARHNSSTGQMRMCRVTRLPPLPGYLPCDAPSSTRPGPDTP
jgi:hypothetical protein